MALAWQLLALTLTAGVEQREIDDQALCPSAAELRVALRGADRPPGEPSLRLKVAARGGDLEVALANGDGQPVARRTLSTQGVPCEELAHAVALLVEAWVAELPYRAESPPAGAASPPAPAPAPPTPAGAGAPAGAARPPSPSPAPAPAPTPGGAGAPAGAARPPSPRPAPSLLLRAGGLLPLGLFPGSVGAAPDLALELALGQSLTFGVEGAVLTDLSGRDSGGSATLHRQQVGLYGGATFGRGGAKWLTLALGAEDQRAQVTARSYPNTGSASVEDPALTASVLFAHVLVGRLFVFGRAEVALPLSRQTFFVTDPGTSNLIELSALDLDLCLGLGLRLF